MSGYYVLKIFIVKIVGFCEGCDQNGDRVSKNDKRCHIHGNKNIVYDAKQVPLNRIFNWELLLLCKLPLWSEELLVKT